MEIQETERNEEKIMKKIRALAGTVLMVAWPLVVGAADAPKPVVSLEGEATVVLCAACPDPKVRVGVIPEGNFKIKLDPVEHPEITEVALGNMRDASIQRMFQPTWIHGNDGTPQALEIKVKGILKPGTYGLSLSLQPRSAPAAPRLKIQVVYPEADLEVPAKLTIYRVKPFYGSPKEEKAQLDLRETKGLAPLTGIRFQSRGAVSASRPVNGRLDIQLPADRIEA